MNTPMDTSVINVSKKYSPAEKKAAKIIQHYYTCIAYDIDVGHPLKRSSNNKQKHL